MPGKHYMPKDLTGIAFGDLTVIRLDESRSTKSHKFWVCKCACGKETSVSRANLISGRAKSCGCQRYMVRKGKLVGTSVGHDPLLYRRWYGMVHGCYDPEHRWYKRFGAKGVTVCPEWRSDTGFKVFREWAKTSGYNEDNGITKLAVKDISLGFSPDNCYWAETGGLWLEGEGERHYTYNVKIITYRGVSGRSADWANWLGVGRSTLIYRLDKSGDDLKKACEQPFGFKKIAVDLDAKVDQFLASNGSSEID